MIWLFGYFIAYHPQFVIPSSCPSSSHCRLHHPPIVIPSLCPSSSHHPPVPSSCPSSSHQRSHHPPIIVSIVVSIVIPSSCPSSSRRRAHHHHIVMPSIHPPSRPPSIASPLDWAFSLRDRPLPFDNPTLSVPMFDKEHDEV